jgi:hypothetical protein
MSTTTPIRIHSQVSDDPDPPLDAAEVLAKDIRNHALRQATHAQFSPLIETKIVSAKKPPASPRPAARPMTLAGRAGRSR